MPISFRVIRHATSRRIAVASRSAKPRLLAYSNRRMIETCGCGEYYPSSCGQNHSGQSGPGCGHYYPLSCGSNHSNKP